MIKELVAGVLLGYSVFTASAQSSSVASEDKKQSQLELTLQEVDYIRNTLVVSAGLSQQRGDTLSQFSVGRTNNKTGVNGTRFAFEYPKDQIVNGKNYNTTIITYILFDNKQERYSITYVNFARRDVIALFDGYNTDPDGIPDYMACIKGAGWGETYHLLKYQSSLRTNMNEVYRDNLHEITPEDDISYWSGMRKFLEETKLIPKSE